MKKPALNPARAFTLIELLVVIAIIAILAGLILPALARARLRTQISRCLLEMTDIVNAIHKYETDYGKMPVSGGAMNAALAHSEDFTYGTAGLSNLGASPGVGVENSYSDYNTNNAEIMAVLLDMEYYPNNVKTVNFGHVKNTQRTKLLDPKFVSDPTLPGVGPDGVYRDVWGQPYIITLDLNNDEKARDGLYKTRTVSEDASDTTGNPKKGLYGLVPAVVAGTPVYEQNSPVMVWSAGPDKSIDSGPANKGANKDNILSWKE
jgi:prepilin-type N-terminal cleavage/methylation domain-containing protein